MIQILLRFSHSHDVRIVDSGELSPKSDDGGGVSYLNVVLIFSSRNGGVQLVINEFEC